MLMMVIRVLLLAEPRSVLLVALRAVGLVERADDEVCDKGICAVFLNVECRVGRWVNVCHYLNEILQQAPGRRRKESRARRKDFSSCPSGVILVTGAEPQGAQTLRLIL